MPDSMDRKMITGDLNSNPVNYIDAHQHFWKFDSVRDSWIDESMKLIQRDFLPPDLEPLLHQNGFTGCVVVQSDQSAVENDFQLANAHQHDFIKGIVGWVDLQADNVEDRLEYYSQFKKLKGFRHVLQGELQRDLMLQPSFKHGISLLSKFGFTYDILIFPDQLKYATELVKLYPEQPFVLDHLAKPTIKSGDAEGWKSDIIKLAAYKNVHCKLSGMVTEADWQNWKVENFKPYIDIVVNAFGVERIMFGSDWPVCLVAATYEQVLTIVQQYFSSFTKNEQDKFFGGNASRFYKL